MMQTTRSSVLRLLAMLVLLLTATVWFGGGSHWGWTQTQVTETHLDEFTGIEYPVQRDAFIPGVEFLAAGAFVAVALGAASLVGMRQPRRATTHDAAASVEA